MTAWDWTAKRREGLDRLHQMMQDLGIRRRSDDEPAISSHTITIGASWDDPAPNSQRCTMCLRELHPRRKAWRYDLTPQPFCGVCASLADAQPYEMVGRWIGNYGPVKRTRLIMAHGIDPYTAEPESATIDFATVREVGDDVVVAATEHYSGHVAVVGMPRTFWDLWVERGGRI